MHIFNIYSAYLKVQFSRKQLWNTEVEFIGSMENQLSRPSRSKIHKRLGHNLEILSMLISNVMKNSICVQKTTRNLMPLASDTRSTKFAAQVGHDSQLRPPGLLCSIFTFPYHPHHEKSFLNDRIFLVVTEGRTVCHYFNKR